MALIMCHRMAMDKKIVEAMATKFSENFAMCGLTHLNATPTFKNRSDLWATLGTLYST